MGHHCKLIQIFGWSSWKLDKIGTPFLTQSHAKPSPIPRQSKPLALSLVRDENGLCILKLLKRLRAQGVKNLRVAKPSTWNMGHDWCPPLNITQPLGIWSIMATIRWCPIYQKWDSYQPLLKITSLKKMSPVGLPLTIICCQALLIGSARSCLENHERKDLKSLRHTIG